MIRRLRLIYCYSISDNALSDAAPKLPLLEDLEISYHSLSNESLEAVGLCCPLLKSLKLNCQGFRHPHMVYDNEAVAIAKTMPELRRLQLFGNKLTNEGLQAILDGCPHLQSLDLRQCFNITLAGNLGKRCAEQIKDLQRPFDSTEGYEFNAEIHDNYDDYDDESYDEDSPLVSDDDEHYEFSDGSDCVDYNESYDFYFD